MLETEILANAFHVFDREGKGYISKVRSLSNLKKVEKGSGRW